MEPLKLAVIGAGRIGRIHATNLATRIEGARLVAVADISPGVAEALADRLHVPRAVQDHGPLLEDASLDAVVICSATDTHARLVEEAAAHGKHIFCEKPLDLDLGRIRRALAAVEQAGVKLQVGFNRRFDPSFARVRDLVARGEIGVPHIVRITSRDPAPPPIEYVRVSGGLPLDMTIHDFDMVRFLTGQEAVEIYAVGGALIDPAIGEAGDVDTCVITIRLSGGAFATIDNSRRAVYGYDQRVEVFGSAGAAAAENRTPDGHVLSTVTGVTSAKPLHFFLERYEEAYVREMQEFVNCLREGRQPSVGGKDGVEPVRMGLAAIRSLREGRPVRLTEIG